MFPTQASELWVTRTPEWFKWLRIHMVVHGDCLSLSHTGTPRDWRMSRIWARHSHSYPQKQSKLCGTFFSRKVSISPCWKRIVHTNHTSMSGVLRKKNPTKIRFDEENRSRSRERHLSRLISMREFCLSNGVDSLLSILIYSAPDWLFIYSFLQPGKPAVALNTNLLSRHELLKTRCARKVN